MRPLLRIGQLVASLAAPRLAPASATGQRYGGGAVVRSGVAALAWLFMCGCGEPPAPGLLGTLDLGARDTVVVASTVEESPIGLVEDLRVVSDEAAEVVLGDVVALAALSDDRFVYWDASFHELRLHSPSGELLDVLGREGEGPGEFKTVHGLAVTSADQIVAWDGGNNRITVLEPTGELVSTSGVDIAVNDAPHFALISDSTVSLKDIDAPPSASSEQAWKLVVHSLLDQSDSLLTRLPLKESSHTPLAIGRYLNFPVQTVTDIGREGRMAVGRGDSYVVDYFTGDALVRLSRSVAPVEVLDEEGENWREAVGPLERMTGDDFPVPASKPYFRRLVVGDQGRLWVERYVPGIRLEEGECLGRTPLCWVEPATFDVFGLDGRYNGTVVLPSANPSLLVVDGSVIWVAERGTLDTHELVRYRLLDG